MALNPQELRQKLAGDYQIMMPLMCPTTPRIRAYATAATARAGKEVTQQEGAAGTATIYDVTYHFPVPVSKTAKTTDVVVRFQLLALGPYPFAEPLVEVVSRPLPWVPHVSPAGRVCITTAWIRSGGQYLLPELVIHVAKLLNFDEKKMSSDYSAFREDAVSWWLSTRQGQPINPDLVYPQLPLHLTHGIRRAGLFRPLGDASATEPRAPRTEANSHDTNRPHSRFRRLAP